MKRVRKKNASSRQLGWHCFLRFNEEGGKARKNSLNRLLSANVSRFVPRLALNPRKFYMFRSFDFAFFLRCLSRLKFFISNGLEPVQAFFNFFSRHHCKSFRSRQVKFTIIRSGFSFLRPSWSFTWLRWTQARTNCIMQVRRNISRSLPIYWKSEKLCSFSDCFLCS